MTQFPEGPFVLSYARRGELERVQERSVATLGLARRLARQIILRERVTCVRITAPDTPGHMGTAWREQHRLTDDGVIVIESPQPTEVEGVLVW